MTSSVKLSRALVDVAMGASADLVVRTPLVCVKPGRSYRALTLQ
jgi:hypothetical protein